MPLLHVHRETAAIHTARDRVFGVNEEAYETDTGYSKRGNGVDSYTELEYYVDASTALTSDELDAIQGAAAPDAGNVFATMDDVGVAGAAETAATIGNIITGTAAKGTIVDGDEFGVSDSEAAGDFVGILWSTIKTTMLAYIDDVIATLTNKTINGTNNTLSIKQATVLPGTHPAGEIIQLDSTAVTADENKVYIGDAVTANASIEIKTALSNNTIDVGNITADDQYHGVIREGRLAGATIAQFEAVICVAGVWELADADGAGLFPAAGIAAAAYVDTDPAVVIQEGYVRNDAWAWTPDAPIYLSAATPGALTQTAPVGSGDNVQIVGWAETADVAYFKFDNNYVTLA
jgi:hypothetical protein